MNESDTTSVKGSDAKVKEIGRKRVSLAGEAQSSMHSRLGSRRQVVFDQIEAFLLDRLVANG